MKKIISILLLGIIALAAFETEARKTPGEKVGVAFDALSYDFGNADEEGPSVVHEFTYTNTGKDALTLLTARPSCGCTQPKFSRKPLKPGESATITLTFVPRGWKGEVDKDVRLRFKNASGKSEEITLRLTGVVIPAAGKAKK